MPENAARVSVYLVSPDARHPHYGLQWRDPDTGKRRTRTSGTALESEARKRAAVLEEKLNSGDASPDGGTARVLTWAEARARYEAEHLAALAATTRHQTRSALAKVEAVLTPTLLRHVNEDALARLRLALERSGLCVVSVHNVLKLVRAALRWMARRKLIAAAPHVEMPQLPDFAPPSRLLGAAGYADLRKRLSAAWHPFLDLGWYAGLRRGELIAVRWERCDLAPYLDLEALRVRFPPGASKSKRADVLPVHPELARLLGPAKDSGRVCAGVPADPSKCTRGFKAACAAAGYDLEPHDLRRSFIDRYARAMLPQELMQLARHKSFATTQRYYSLRPHLDELILRADEPKKKRGG